MTLALTLDQANALSEIGVAVRAGERHLLTGYAGSGKTTLMQEVARENRRLHRSVVLTAPTHKAVSVLRKKVQQAGLVGVECKTLSSLLSLKPETQGDRQVFTRKKNADPVTEDVVVIDECSMVSAEVMRHIGRHLQQSFTLFVGDPAQLPPIGEVASKSFDTPSHSHLDTIVRQGAGNPVLDAAHAIRRSQGGAMDWTWCCSSKAPPHGVFKPANPETWMRHAFTSSRFGEDPDQFRYLCWTNERVAHVNAKVRRWIYGPDIDQPFMADERALVRAPLIHDGSILCNTNEEVWVVSIARAMHRFGFEQRDTVASWTAEVASWEVRLRRDDGQVVVAHLCRDDRTYRRICDRLTDEAADARSRWRDLHAFKSSMIRLENIYAMTVHTSQGSTFTNVFIDVPDIRRRVESNTLEAQQLFYVAATRPTDAIVLVGAP